MDNEDAELDRLQGAYKSAGRHLGCGHKGRRSFVVGPPQAGASRQAGGGPLRSRRSPAQDARREGRLRRGNSVEILRHGLSVCL